MAESKKILWYDLETTGLNKELNAIHQIAGLVEIEGEIVESFDIRLRPWEGAILEPVALEVGKVTEDILNSYPSQEEGFEKFYSLVTSHLNLMDKNDKFTLAGYNNIWFDDPYLANLFHRQKCQNFYGFFNFQSGDVLKRARKNINKWEIANFKLMTVAKHLGLKIQEEFLHNAVYDIFLTRAIYMILQYDTPPSSFHFNTDQFNNKG